MHVLAYPYSQHVSQSLLYIYLVYCIREQLLLYLHVCIFLIATGVCLGASNSDRDIKLESTEQISSMILQIKRADEWRSVCYRQWGTADAEVACRELGYRHVESTYGVPPSRASQYNRAWTTDVECRGNENLFYQCKHSGYSKFNCSDKALDVVGINCTSEECFATYCSIEPAIIVSCMYIYVHEWMCAYMVRIYMYCM